MSQDAEGWYTTITCVFGGSIEYIYKTRDPTIRAGDVVCVMARDTPKLAKVAHVHADAVEDRIPFKWTTTIKG